MIDYVFFCLRFWAHRGRAKLSCALIGSCRCRVALAHPDSVCASPLRHPRIASGPTPDHPDLGARQRSHQVYLIKLIL
ncbi:hypothetical protein HBI33_123070 [Parastagonospora nodorum]|nr:hypothetical protein HBI33_123070 [Parastagonospora nodorum]